MPLVYATPASEHRAIEVQGILARLGQHRAPSVPDLLIASLAETQGLVLQTRISSSSPKSQANPSNAYCSTATEPTAVLVRR